MCLYKFYHRFCCRRTLGKRRCLILLLLLCTFIVVYWSLFSSAEDGVTLWDKSQGKSGEKGTSSGLRYVANLQAERGCVNPIISLNSSDLNPHIYNVSPIVCNEENEGDWISTEGGKFLISSEAEKIHGRILCVYMPVIRVDNSDDAIYTSKKIFPMLNGSLLMSDAFKVVCKAADGKKYANIHAAISVTPDVEDRIAKMRMFPIKDGNINVLMFGLDSVSRHMWRRALRKTHKYFTSVLGGSVLEGYNIVGDGTTQALFPILTGRTEIELPEARRGKLNAVSLDNFPFIFKAFKEHGYVTQWGEDMAHIGTFNLRLMGFKRQPVQHYLRPFFLAAIPNYGHFKPYCLGSKPRHVVMLNWIKEFVSIYEHYPKFSFVFNSELSHEDNNNVGLLDDDILDFLKYLNTNGHLQNTVLVMMSDHGSRFHSFRNTEQGKLEERLPYFGFLFPPLFYQKYPTLMNNFHQNTKLLVTPFDIHETFMDILNGSGNGDTSKRGISLLRRIPITRTCKEAHVEPHWCACMPWLPVNVNDTHVLYAVQSAVNFFNELTKTFRAACYELQLHKVVKAAKVTTSADVLRFRKSLDEDGRKPDMNDTMRAQQILYQVTFYTTPGNGLFEATVRYQTETLTYHVSESEVSRINKYGDASKCIFMQAPHLRQYCVCRNIYYY
ncbi:hypothetical protein ACJMK2_017950 [Sinanodonta woodiana]|uniref:DUF229 domain containing protein n=1 Tax=Sinanodonta woodiana TaxID=1069815 RepID=A0ABD3UEL8_SINWO